MFLYSLSQSRGRPENYTPHIINGRMPLWSMPKESCCGFSVCYAALLPMPCRLKEVVHRIYAVLAAEELGRDDGTEGQRTAVLD